MGGWAGDISVPSSLGSIRAARLPLFLPLAPRGRVVLPPWDSCQPFRRSGARSRADGTRRTLQHRRPWQCESSPRTWRGLNRSLSSQRTPHPESSSNCSSNLSTSVEARALRTLFSAVWRQRPAPDYAQSALQRHCVLPFHRAVAALRAISERCAEVSFFNRAFPPFWPCSRKNSKASADSFFLAITLILSPFASLCNF
jgi:hypothetical protein